MEFFWKKNKIHTQLQMMRIGVIGTHLNPIMVVCNLLNTHFSFDDFFFFLLPNQFKTVNLYKPLKPSVFKIKAPVLNMFLFSNPT
jgi:hypothetical protein